MTSLTLRPGPVLLHRSIQRNEEGARPTDVNVSARAIEFLFEPVALDNDLTLGEIFRLLDFCPELRQVFRRDFAEELCAQARKGAVPQSRGSDPEAVAGIEFLELYWSWALDTDTKTYSSIHRLDLHGVGRVLDVDAPEYGVKAGGRIHWSVSLTPVRELLDLPVRVREALSITEDDVNAKGYGHVVAAGRCPDVTLGQIIHGLLWELSFHGSPEEQAGFHDELLARKAEVDSGQAELIPADEVFEEFDLPGIQALFETTGGVTTAEIRRAMHEMEDDQPAGAWFEQQFGGRVVVKAQFHSRGGREFRKAFRVAGR